MTPLKISEIQPRPQGLFTNPGEVVELPFTVFRLRAADPYPSIQGFEILPGDDHAPGFLVAWDPADKLTAAFHAQWAGWPQHEPVGSIAFNPDQWEWQETNATRVSPEIFGFANRIEDISAPSATIFPADDTHGLAGFGLVSRGNETGCEIKLTEAVFRASVLRNILIRTSNVPIPSETIRALNRIKELPDDWDGDGASKIEEETVSKATSLIREAFLASSSKLEPPSVAPAFGGMIVAEWSGPGGRELILDIPPGDEPPGFLLVEPSDDGNEIETDAEIGNFWSIRDVIARLNGE